MDVDEVLEQIAVESGFDAVALAVSQLLDRSRDGTWKDVITTADVVRLLLRTGTSRNSPTIRAATKWLLQQQDSASGAWNDEVWDTSVALLALHAAGHEVTERHMKKGIQALADQFDPLTGSWWDIWDSSIAVQCLTRLGVEENKVDAGTTWLMSKRYPAPEHNWLNIHTTASVLEGLWRTDARWDPGALEAKRWLQMELGKRSSSLDIWSLALGVRALNRYSQTASPDALIEDVVRSRFIPAVREGTLDTVDLTQVALTLVDCAPGVMRPATVKAIVDLAEKNQTGLAELFVSIVCAWKVGGRVHEEEERKTHPSLVTIRLTTRQVQIIGVVASLTTLAAALLAVLRWLGRL